MGQPPGGPDDWPDLDGAMPPGWDPKDWQIAVGRATHKKTYKQIGEAIGISTGNISVRISRMRAQFGQDFLRVKGTRPERAKRATGDATAHRWAEIRKLTGGKFGGASVKATELIHSILDRYLEDEEMLNALTVSDAVDLARLAQTMGTRADEMVGPLPHQSPDLTPSDLFNAIDSSVSDSATRVTLQKIELIVDQFGNSNGNKPELTEGDPGLELPAGDVEEAEVVEVVEVEE